MILFYFQDVVGLWAKLADQGIAIAVLIVIGVFGLLFFTKALPVWERVKTAESKALSDLAVSQTQIASVVKEVAIEQKRSTDAVKILQRVNAESNENLAQSNDNLASEVQTLTEITQKIVDRLDLLEKKNV